MWWLSPAPSLSSVTLLSLERDLYRERLPVGHTHLNSFPWWIHSLNLPFAYLGFLCPSPSCHLSCPRQGESRQKAFLLSAGKDPPTWRIYRPQKKSSGIQRTYSRREIQERVDLMWLWSSGDLQCECQERNRIRIRILYSRKDVFQRQQYFIDTKHKLLLLWGSSDHPTKTTTHRCNPQECLFLKNQFQLVGVSHSAKWWWPREQLQAPFKPS